MDLPADFLQASPGAGALPITVQRVDFSATALPEYKNCYATVLDNVLSAEECAALLGMAEASAPTGGWAPALVNAGSGYEVMVTDYRKCDR